MKYDYDIIVVGSGPAGSVFCKLISDKYNTCIIDKKTSDYSSFHKPCGGLLSEDAQKAFATLGMTFPKDIIVDPQIFSVKTIDLNSNIIRHYQRFYLNFDRHKFDMWMSSLIPSHVTKINGNCISVSKIENCFEIKYTDCNGNQKHITSKYIVGADGANSIVRNSFYPKKKQRKYIAIQQWFDDEHPQPFYSCIFDSKTSDCCSWSISKDKYFIFGGAFKYKDSREMFELQKQKLSAMGFKFGKPLKTEACLVMRPSNPASFCTGKNNIFLIGESAGFVSPSSLEGISSAIISAKKLSGVFNKNPANKNRIYFIKMIPLMIKLSAKLLKCPFMYNSFLRKLVMKSGLNSIKIINS